MQGCRSGKQGHTGWRPVQLDTVLRSNFQTNRESNLWVQITDHGPRRVVVVVCTLFCQVVYELIGRASFVLLHNAYDTHTYSVINLTEYF